MPAAIRLPAFTRRTLIGLIMTLSVPVAGWSQTASDRHDYRLWYRNYDSPAIYNLVRLALTKTPEYGPFTLVRSQEISQGRALHELASGSSNGLVEIANVATSVYREETLTPIPVPVDGGLLGFRVCLILPEKLDLFANIQSLEDLRRGDIRIGQGSHWPDTPVLHANGIDVVTHARYEILFGMLRNDRFDCFARGISEVLYDLRRERADDLIIEPDLLLAYPMPSYLFVGKNDHETAQRLQLGLERAIEDGSFGEYLDKWFGRAIEELNLEERTVIALENPYLSEDSRHIAREALYGLARRIELLNQAE